MPRVARRIDKVGIELEGYWETERPEGSNGEHHGDGSVGGFNSCDCEDCDGDCESASLQGIVGEFVSRPMPPSKVSAWIGRNYPDRVNDSCGLHVHLSLRSRLHYAQAMDGANGEPGAYVPTLLQALKGWGESASIYQGSPFWSRLSGANTYCRIRDIDPDAQVKARSKIGQRYRAVNFCHTLHGTLEIRILPMFRGGRNSTGASLAISAVSCLLATTEAWLASLPILIEKGEPVAISDSLPSDIDYRLTYLPTPIPSSLPAISEVSTLERTL